MTWFIGLAKTAAQPVADTPEAAFERYRAEINSHDFDRLAATVISPEAVFIFTDGIHRGETEARAAFNAAWAAIADEVYTMSNAEWVMRDTHAALVVFRYEYRGTARDGRSLQGGGRGTNLFVRTPAGWRLRYEHLSHDPRLRPAG